MNSTDSAEEAEFPPETNIFSTFFTKSDIHYCVCHFFFVILQRKIDSFNKIKEP